MKSQKVVRPYLLGNIASANPILLRRCRRGVEDVAPYKSDSIIKLVLRYRLMRRWGYIGGNPFPYVVLGVGVYRGGGIETPAPIRIFATLSLREESVKKELIILR